MSESAHWASLLRHMDPAQRDDDAAVKSRLRDAFSALFSKAVCLPDALQSNNRTRSQLRNRPRRRSTSPTTSASRSLNLTDVAIVAPVGAAARNGLDNCRISHHPSDPTAAAAAAAFFARPAANRRPYSRAHKEVKISVTSRTRSSSGSLSSTTTTRRPCAPRAASTYSPPKRQYLSRCSTMIVRASRIPGKLYR